MIFGCVNASPSEPGGQGNGFPVLGFGRRSLLPKGRNRHDHCHGGLAGLRGRARTSSLARLVLPFGAGYRVG
jgi:hypothetical protein